MTWMGRGARSLQHQARLLQEVMAKILRERRGSNQGWRGLPIDKPGQFHQPSLAIVFASCNGMIEYNFLHKMKTYETSATLVFKAILRCLSPNSTKCEKYKDFLFIFKSSSPGLSSTGGRRRRPRRPPRTRRHPRSLPSPALPTASLCPFVVKLKLNQPVCQDCEKYSLDLDGHRKKSGSCGSEYHKYIVTKRASMIKEVKYYWKK